MSAAFATTCACQRVQFVTVALEMPRIASASTTDIRLILRAKCRQCTAVKFSFGILHGHLLLGVIYLPMGPGSLAGFFDHRLVTKPFQYRNVRTFAEESSWRMEQVPNSDKPAVRRFSLGLVPWAN